MTALESVALDQRRWISTAFSLKDSNWARFQVMAALTVAGAILEASALQMHVSNPVISQIAGYSGAAAWGLVLVIRAKGLQRERAQAWVMAEAAAESLLSEMYRYRTSCGPYSDHFEKEATLLRRRDAILEKVKLIKKYIIEPKPKPLPPLGPLNAEAYIAERVNGQIEMFRKLTKILSPSQTGWLKREFALVAIAIIAAVVLTLTHNQVYGAWTIIAAFLSIVLGASTKLERYATLTVELQSMPDRLAGILETWRANQGTLEELVRRIESALLAGFENWVAVLEEDTPEQVRLPLEPALHAPVSRIDAQRA